MTVADFLIPRNKNIQHFLIQSIGETNCSKQDLARRACNLNLKLLKYGIETSRHN